MYDIQCMRPNICHNKHNYIHNDNGNSIMDFKIIFQSYSQGHIP